jgi:hypothetical protein
MIKVDEKIEGQIFRDRMRSILTSCNRTFCVHGRQLHGVKGITLYVCLAVVELHTRRVTKHEALFSDLI